MHAQLNKIKRGGIVKKETGRKVELNIELCERVHWNLSQSYLIQ